MARKEVTQTAQQSDKKLRTKDLIYAGAFGAVYIVLMLIVVLGTSAIPVLYILAPFTVGVVCATVYELCVLKVHKFGAALILGVLFALVACSGNVLGMVLAVACALAAEFIIMAGQYKSRKMFLLSFLAFNLNMVCPYTMLYFHRDEFMARSVSFYGQDYADQLATIRGADRILVMDKGRTIEQGSHPELIQKNGMYRRMTGLQEKMSSWSREVSA